MKPIALFGTGIKSLSATVTAQRRVNGFYDIRTDEDKTKIVLRGTPGCFVQYTLTDGPVRGWRVVGDYKYVVAGSTVFRVANDHSFTVLGTISNTGQYVSMDDNSIQLIMVDGSRGYAIALPGGAPTLITDANFPNGATTVAILNTRAICEVPNTRSYYVSSQLDVTLWTPIIFGTKENSSDLLIAVDVLNGMLILWGAKNMECWQDIGTSPNPYSRVNGLSQTWGLAAKYSRALLDNSMIFLAQNPQGGVQVMLLKGYVPQRVSTSDIENIITSFTVFSDALGLTYMVDGHPMYQLTFPAANRSFLFDSITNMWYETQSGVGDNVRHFANLGIVFHTENYVSDANSGAVSQLSSALFTENGNPIKRMVTSRHVRLDGNEFSISDINLEIEVGNALISGQGSNPQIMMQVSIDGGKTFGVERWKSLGRQGQFRKRVNWDRIGSATDFVFRFTMTDPVQWVITLAEAVISPGTEAAQ